MLEKQEKEILNKIIRVHKHTEARDNEENKLKEAQQQLMKKIDEITKIRQDIQTAENARDHYEKSRQKYSMELGQLEETRDHTKIVLARLYGIKAEQNETQ